MLPQYADISPAEQSQEEQKAARRAAKKSPSEGALRVNEEVKYTQDDENQNKEAFTFNLKEGARVLLVDHNYFNLVATHCILQQYGFECD